MGVGPFPGQVAQCQLKDQLKREIFLYLSLFHCSSWMFLAALAALYPHNLNNLNNINNLNLNLPSFLPSFLQKTCSTIQTLKRAVSQFLRSFIILLTFIFHLPLTQCLHLLAFIFQNLHPSPPLTNSDGKALAQDLVVEVELYCLFVFLYFSIL